MFRFSALLLTCAALSISSTAQAMPDEISRGMAPHHAVYDIDLIATHSGSQILNISGDMSYEWVATCDSWTTDHHFKLFYEYADAPGMRIVSDFTTFEKQDGSELQFTSRRKRNGEMYQEIRGVADIGSKGGLAKYTKPEGIHYDLTAGTLFPVGHTVELIRQAKAGKKLFNAQVFDGSDEDGPIEINAFIGKEAKAPPKVASKEIDESLLDSPAWKIRMAVFPSKDKEEESDYEMTMVFHENGVISDMVIEYDDFTVRQKLTSLKKTSSETCDLPAEVPKKP